MRRKIVAGNWKMHLNKKEAIALAKTIVDESLPNDFPEILLFPGSIYLDVLLNVARSSKVKIGAQNFYPKTSGAFTGEISIEQLQQLGVDTLLIGHSERRELFFESNAFIKEKVNAAVKQQMQMVFCCGEPLSVREKGLQNQFVQQQMEESLLQLSSSAFNHLVAIAYEPIWAIGTGITATPQQAEEMHAFIRSLLREKYGDAIADVVPILYGGSCKPSNAEELFVQENIDGGLIGGASLNGQVFMDIVSAMKVVSQ
jgi:triosephosphate isomerase